MNEKTRFTTLIRIDPKQKEYIRENLTHYRTLAGRLDFIINLYKKHATREARRNQARNN